MKRKFSMAIVLLLSLFGSSTMAQQKFIKVSGKVTSFEESLALEGVSIYVKGTKNYTGTQADGTFSIDVSPDHQVLVFELKDYETTELIVSGGKEYDVALKRNAGNAQVSNGHRYLNAFVNQRDPSSPLLKWETGCVSAIRWPGMIYN